MDVKLRGIKLITVQIGSKDRELTMTPANWLASVTEKVVGGIY